MTSSTHHLGTLSQPVSAPLWRRTNRAVFDLGESRSIPTGDRVSAKNRISVLPEIKTTAVKAVRLAVATIVVTLFFPIVVLTWIAVALDRMCGRANGANATTVEGGDVACLGSPKATPSPVAITADQRAWIAEMNSFDRF
jgi:hypothetical protein